MLPVHTYSIVARDPVTGELGIAVQSHYFSVGSVVPWAEPGVGAVAVQSFVSVTNGPAALALLRAGRTASAALAEIIARDPEQELRQMGVVDAAGIAAAHTGERCIPAAGHLVGEGYAVQANIMTDDGGWPAMARGYETASGDLADRLLAALDAAQDAGGDLRGQQSAALQIVSGARPAQPGEGKLFDVRVEDHPQPLVELRRLLRLARAYRFVEDADAAAGRGQYDAAAAAYRAAVELAPEIAELRLMAALALLGMGDEAAALPLFAQALSADPGLLELVHRAAPLGLAPSNPDLLARLAAMCPPR
jgi:uncharacterized Ntn-hydrolase superfamily protein